jgi:HEAT repeat protein
MDWAAVEAPKFGGAAVPGLLALLNDADPLVRAGAAVALGEIGDRRATAPLVAILCGDEKELRVRAAAAAGLGVLKDPEAVEHLVKAVQAGDWNCAAYALGDIGDPKAVPALIEKAERDIHEIVDNHTNLSATVALGRIGKAAVGPLVEEVKKNGWIPAITVALGRIGEPAIEPVAAFLDHPDEGARAGAADALGYMESAKAVPPLLKALQDKDAEVRACAAHGLMYNNLQMALLPLLAFAGQSGEEEYRRVGVLDRLPPDPRCIDPLVAMLRRETSKTILEYTALALGRIPDPKAVQALAACLKDEKDAGRRAAAAAGLGEAKDPAALAALLAALGDADAGVCRSAVESLGARGDLTALPALAEVAEKNPDARIREAAVEAVERIERKNP